MNTSEMIDKFIAHYSEHYEILYNVEISGVTAPVVASMKNREDMSVFGFSLKRPGPEAAEHVFILKEECFNLEALSKVKDMLETSEAEYIHPSRDHSFTFLSAVVVAESVDDAVPKLLKKYKFGKNYRENGWMLSRVAVFCTDGNTFYNRDGGSLEKLLKEKLK